MKKNKDVMTRNVIICADIKKWTSTKKHYRIKKLICRGGIKMAVSMATIPVITGQAAKEMMEALKTPTITKKFIEECKKETRGITIKRIR